MKKQVFAVFLVLLLAVSVIGCTEQETLQETVQATVYKTDINGKTHQVDTAKKTISDGKYTYQYDFSGDVSSYRVEIIYPNWSSYWWNGSESGGSGGWSGDYDVGTYAHGDALVRAVAAAEGLEETKERNEGYFGRVLVGLILIGFGVFGLIAPETSWYLSHGWQYKNVEPSDTALTFARIGGGIAVFIGIGFLLRF